jgi:peptide/nickel transport system permease protein
VGAIVPGRYAASAPRRWWRQYVRSPSGTIALAILVVFLLGAAFPTVFTSHPPQTRGPDPFRPPSSGHPMGTDDLGRDVFSGVVHASRTSLLVGFLSVAIAALIGVGIGAVSGYYGGASDSVLTGVTEWVQVIPRFLLALLLVAIWGGSIWNVIVAIGILSWPLTARLVRAEFFTLREREFVLAARALGSPDTALMLRHVLPNALAPVVVTASLEIGNAILLEAGMSFLGLGDPQTMSWGGMLYNAQGFFRRAWWMSAFPGAAIFLVVVSLNLIGDRFNELLNVRLLDR